MQISGYIFGFDVGCKFEFQFMPVLCVKVAKSIGIFDKLSEIVPHGELLTFNMKWCIRIC